MNDNKKYCSVEGREEAIRQTISKKPENERLEYLIHFSALQQTIADTQGNNRDFWMKKYWTIFELMKKANKKLRSPKKNRLDTDYLSYPDEDDRR